MSVKFIQLHVDFFTSVKTRKLQRKLGEEGVISLLRLFNYTAQHRPDGKLNMTADDIELVADWKGEPDNFYNTLAELSWLDIESGSVSVHGWAENQPWIASQAERTTRARKGAEARWNKSKHSEKVTPIKPKINEKSKAKKIELNQVAAEIIDHLNTKADRRYTHAKTTLKPIESALLSLSKEQLSAGSWETSKAALIAIIDVKCDEWKGGDMDKHLTPQTLFRPSNIDKYLEQAARDGSQNDKFLDDDGKLDAKKMVLL